MRLLTRGLIEKHGKDTIREVIDMILINQHVDNDKFRMWLIKHGIITHGTKTITTNLGDGLTYYGFSNGEYGKLEVPVSYKRLRAKNGRKQSVFVSYLYEDEREELMEALS